MLCGFSQWFSPFDLWITPAYPMFGASKASGGSLAASGARCLLARCYGGEIHFAAPQRIPGMIRFSCKCQQTMGSAMVSKRCDMDFVHPQYGWLQSPMGSWDLVYFTVGMFQVFGFWLCSLFARGGQNTCLLPYHGIHRASISVSSDRRGSCSKGWSLGSCADSRPSELALFGRFVLPGLIGVVVNPR